MFTFNFLTVRKPQLDIVSTAHLIFFFVFDREIFVWKTREFWMTGILWKLCVIHRQQQFWRLEQQDKFREKKIQEKASKPMSAGNTNK